jgi:hypothetical protein
LRPVYIPQSCACQHGRTRAELLFRSSLGFLPFDEERESKVREESKVFTSTLLSPVGIIGFTLLPLYFQEPLYLFTHHHASMGPARFELAIATAPGWNPRPY